MLRPLGGLRPLRAPVHPLGQPSVLQPSFLLGAWEAGTPAPPTRGPDGVDSSWLCLAQHWLLWALGRVNQRLEELSVTAFQTNNRICKNIGQTVAKSSIYKLTFLYLFHKKKPLLTLVCVYLKAERDIQTDR